MIIHAQEYPTIPAAPYPCEYENKIDFYLGVFSFLSFQASTHLMNTTPLLFHTFFHHQTNCNLTHNHVNWDG